MGYAKSLAVFLNGSAIRRPGEHGEVIKDDSFYLIFNAHHETLPFTLPPQQFGSNFGRAQQQDLAAESSRTRQEVPSMSANRRTQGRAGSSFFA